MAHQSWNDLALQRMTGQSLSNTSLLHATKRHIYFSDYNYFLSI